MPPFFILRFFILFWFFASVGSSNTSEETIKWRKKHQRKNWDFLTNPDLYDYKNEELYKEFLQWNEKIRNEAPNSDDSLLKEYQKSVDSITNHLGSLREKLADSNNQSKKKIEIVTDTIVNIKTEVKNWRYDSLDEAIKKTGDLLVFKIQYLDDQEYFHELISSNIEAYKQNAVVTVWEKIKQPSFITKRIKDYLHFQIEKLYEEIFEMYYSAVINLDFSEKLPLIKKIFELIKYIQGNIIMFQHNIDAFCDFLKEIYDLPSLLSKLKIEKITQKMMTDEVEKKKLTQIIRNKILPGEIFAFIQKVDKEREKISLQTIIMIIYHQDQHQRQNFKFLKNPDLYDYENNKLFEQFVQWNKKIANESSNLDDLSKEYQLSVIQIRKYIILLREGLQPLKLNDRTNSQFEENIKAINTSLAKIKAETQNWKYFLSNQDIGSVEELVTVVIIQQYLNDSKYSNVSISENIKNIINNTIYKDTNQMYYHVIISLDFIYQPEELKKRIALVDKIQENIIKFNGEFNTFHKFVSDLLSRRLTKVNIPKITDKIVPDKKQRDYLIKKIDMIISQAEQKSPEKKAIKFAKIQTNIAKLYLAITNDVIYSSQPYMYRFMNGLLYNIEENTVALYFYLDFKAKTIMNFLSFLKELCELRKKYQEVRKKYQEPLKAVDMKKQIQLVVELYIPYKELFKLYPFPEYLELRKHEKIILAFYGDKFWFEFKLQKEYVQPTKKEKEQTVIKEPSSGILQIVETPQNESLDVPESSKLPKEYDWSEQQPFKSDQSKKPDVSGLKPRIYLFLFPLNNFLNLLPKIFMTLIISFVMILVIPFIII